jgi:hypothetical protein
MNKAEQALKIIRNMKKNSLKSPYPDDFINDEWLKVNSMACGVYTNDSEILYIFDDNSGLYREDYSDYTLVSKATQQYLITNHFDPFNEIDQELDLELNTESLKEEQKRDFVSDLSRIEHYAEQE